MKTNNFEADQVHKDFQRRICLENTRVAWKHGVERDSSSYSHLHHRHMRCITSRSKSKDTQTTDERDLWAMHYYSYMVRTRRQSIIIFDGLRGGGDFTLSESWLRFGWGMGIYSVQWLNTQLGLANPKHIYTDNPTDHKMLFTTWESSLVLCINYY